MGWTYNAPDGTPTNGPRIVAVTITFTGFTLAIVCLRAYVRGWMVKAFGHDDWMIMVSWVGTCVYSLCTVVQTKWGLGVMSLEDMPPGNVYNFGLVQYIGAPFYVVGIWGFKMSLLLSYLRFFQGRYHTAAVFVGIACTLAHIAFVCVFLFLCTPISKQWDPAITYGHCAAAVPFYLSFSSLTICFDLMVIILPFPVLLQSKIPRRRKAALLILFALGIFVTVIQVIRIQTIRSLANYLDSAEPITWSIVEANIGVTIACIPTLAPLFKYFSERSRSGTGSGSRRPPELRYALRTWGSGTRALGHRSHNETEVSGVRRGTGDSTELILDADGITKTLDVTVTRQPHQPAPDSRASADTLDDDRGHLQVPAKAAAPQDM
ncbi:hypothetical protein GGS23DRAFT_620414 [Durotheca rogersii]|uniref:uncharacterized protein n=1 Tax=Durotheca rogersii TaxID=419775 RepID=UPI00221FDF54|nr:uncharacterized protein GGS23DRAFT_620414 [Durotheca rogersii]KAI5863631.1 hypothetical protein GGS23DRAFT_620414 [Durotheca rogersii]